MRPCTDIPRVSLRVCACEWFNVTAADSLGAMEFNSIEWNEQWGPIQWPKHAFESISFQFCTTLGYSNSLLSSTESLQPKLVMKRCSMHIDSLLWSSIIISISNRRKNRFQWIWYSSEMFFLLLKTSSLDSLQSTHFVICGWFCCCCCYLVRCCCFWCWCWCS